VFYFGVLVLSFSIFVGVEDYIRNKEWRSMFSNLKLVEEYVKEGEDLDIGEVVAILESIIYSRLNGTLDDPNLKSWAKRAIHPTHWQCLDGTHKVDADIKDHLQVGLFKKSGMSFSADTRTAHISFRADSDLKISLFSVKVHAKGGPRIDISDYSLQLQKLNKETQDFTFVSHDTFRLLTKF